MRLSQVRAVVPGMVWVVVNQSYFLEHKKQLLLPHQNYISCNSFFLEKKYICFLSVFWNFKSAFFSFYFLYFHLCFRYLEQLLQTFTSAHLWQQETVHNPYLLVTIMTSWSGRTNNRCSCGDSTNETLKDRNKPGVPKKHFKSSK